MLDARKGPGGLASAFAVVGGIALAGLSVLVAPAPARAASVVELTDVGPDHWAYRAIALLIDRYGVMDGFPDHTFKGNAPVTRYQLAAALVKVILRMEQLSRGGRPIAPTDRATTERLQAELAPEMARLQGRVAVLEDQVATLTRRLDGLVRVGGRVTVNLGDELLDTGKDPQVAAPFIGSQISLGVSGNVNPSTAFNVGIGGNLKAAGSGNSPAVLRGTVGNPTDTNLRFNGARAVTKLGATTMYAGYFGMWMPGIGPGTSLNSMMGDFSVGVGAQGVDASGMRVGSDVGLAMSTSLGPVDVAAGVNSNILATQLGWQWNWFGVKLGYETDHKAITQLIVAPTGPKVKTADNAAVVLDFGIDQPFGLSLQAAANNLSPVAYGGMLRWAPFGIETNLVGMVNADPGQSVSVLSYSLGFGVPSFPLPRGLKTFPISVAFLDNYTISAPPRSDGQETIGPGGQAMGKNAGVSVRVGLNNPVMPNLALEYNVQAKLIESIFLPNPQDQITSEAILLRWNVAF